MCRPLVTVGPFCRESRSNVCCSRKHRRFGYDLRPSAATVSSVRQPFIRATEFAQRDLSVHGTTHVLTLGEADSPAGWPDEIRAASHGPVHVQELGDNTVRCPWTCE